MNEFVESLFKVKGRIARKAFLIRIVTVYILGGVLLATMGYLLPALEKTGSHEAVKFLSMVFLVLSLMFNAAYILLCVRRLHDLNLSGLWLILVVALIIAAFSMFRQLAPVLPILFSIVLLLMPGTKGPNKYGEEAI